PRDLCSVFASLLDHLVHLLGRTNVARQGDTAPSRAVVRNADVGAKLFAPPQGKDDAVALKEGGLLDLECRRPPEGSVECLRSLVVRNTEGHKGYALFHKPLPTVTAPLFDPVDQACATTSRTSTPSSVTASGIIDGTCSLARFAASSESKMTIDSPAFSFRVQ